jgi:SAM-dependent methyltransferase
VTASPDGIAGVFDRAADTYDAVGVPWFGPVAQGLVEELDVQPGEHVLDLGCGRGAALHPLALATGPEGSALGIDLAPRMVERTARDLQHLPQVEVRASGTRGPFGSDEGMERLLTDAGLVDVRTAHREVTATFADPQQWLAFSWSHGQRAMWEAVPAEQHDAVRAEIVPLLEGFSPLGFSQTIRHTLGRRP